MSIKGKDGKSYSVFHSSHGGGWYVQVLNKVALGPYRMYEDMQEALKIIDGHKEDA